MDELDVRPHLISFHIVNKALHNTAPVWYACRSMAGHQEVRVVCLGGDGIGPEVMGAAVQVLSELMPDLVLEERLFGGAAILAGGHPLPAETLSACRGANAVLLAAVGLPELEGADVRPEHGLIRLRRELDVYANLRPLRGKGIDLCIVRELLGGLYYGERGKRDDGTVYDTCEYHPSQVERIARRAFELARARSGRLSSVDKANVLATSALWREVVNDVAHDYPDVKLEHLLVDNAAMQLVLAPDRFDVLVTENTFGDILSDVGAGVTGGLGLAASASLSDHGPGMFEPVHGSAPDIAGQGIANPAAMLRSAALMLQHGLGQHEAANKLEQAVDVALAQTPTRDIGGDATTAEFANAVSADLRARRGNLSFT
jgi:3-isopropylmalate dehydrogenase